MTELRATLSPMTDRPALAARWRALEARAERPFFLSWHWIGTWLEGLDEPPLLLAVSGADGVDVALGLLVPSVERRRKLLKIRQLRLHETGEALRDAITVEYNTLLCAPGMEAAAWRAALTALKAPDAPRWDELVISGATDRTVELLPAEGLALHRRAESESARINLAALREAGVDDAERYIAGLGKNTRSQIRRSMRLYAERGALALDAARDRAEAQLFLDEMAEHHEAKWRAQGRGGAFSNPEYLRFHARLIDAAFAGDAPSRPVELLRARAGDQAFGWLYNFVDRGQVLFYLSGFVAEEDNRLKPGLVTHALAIERHLKAGAEIYDFMGGTNRYKSSLGRSGPEILSIALQRPCLKLWLENAARRLKDRLQSA